MRTRQPIARMALVLMMLSATPVLAQEAADKQAETAAADTAQAPAEQGRVTSVQAPAAGDGPSVELITGGNSSDGAALVTRMPVLD